MASGQLGPNETPGESSKVGNLAVERSAVARLFLRVQTVEASGSAVRISQVSSVQPFWDVFRSRYDRRHHFRVLDIQPRCHFLPYASAEITTGSAKIGRESGEMLKTAVSCGVEAERQVCGKAL